MHTILHIHFLPISVRRIKKMYSFAEKLNELNSNAMKKTTTLLILFIGFFLFLCNNVWAQEVEIEINDDSSTNVKDRRSFSLQPAATIEFNTIRIYTDIATENIHVVVKDSSNNIVYSDVDMNYSICHTFEIVDLQEGVDYILEFEIGNKSFYGYFTVENDI
jgi:hypothetical protein